MKKKKLVAIVGGTGGYTLLRGLQKYSDKYDISAICAMTDDGGSNRLLVTEFGYLPFSDAIQCMLALSDDSVTHKLIGYRFDTSKALDGQRLGNAIYAGLVDILGSESNAIDYVAHQMLKIKGNVIPVTLEKAELVATYKNNRVIQGEHQIDMPTEEWQDKFPITNLSLTKNVKANPEAVKAIKKADIISIGPGDIFTSLLPNLIVGGISDALSKSKAKKVMIMNLMTKYGQTNQMPTVTAHVNQIENYLSKSTIDTVLMNKNFSKKILKNTLKAYERADVFPLIDDSKKLKNIKVVKANLISSTVSFRQKGDRLKRSLIRHDSDKLAKALVGLL